MSTLRNLLTLYRDSSQTEREKGTYFEHLSKLYFENEPKYKALYEKVYTYAEWAHEFGENAKDTGIDLVAKIRNEDSYAAIQCKFYGEEEKLEKRDLDSFFTASGKKWFSSRVIISTTNNWSSNAEEALENQQPPVTKIDLLALEESVIDWSQYHPDQALKFRPKKRLRPHQTQAFNAVTKKLAEVERGKLIMACGTGKTFTSLKITESMVGRGKTALFLVPSLALLSQSLTEWTQESEIPLVSFAVCSDSDVGKKQADETGDLLQPMIHELAYPATTDAARLAQSFKKHHSDEAMTVIFSTYHSIDVLSEAQKQGLADFDLIICDEAHRTTGSTFLDEDDSTFVKVHNQDFIRGDKRLYMTATPRIYGDDAKVKAADETIELYSMDDRNIYGDNLFTINFSDAVKLGLLVDYKVVVLAVDESHVNEQLQSLLADENNELIVNDAAKIVGCWKALSKQDLTANNRDLLEPMKRAVAFCQIIGDTKSKRGGHKVASKNIAGMFQTVIEAYQEKELQDNPHLFDENPAAKLQCEAEHIDGSMNASEKAAKLEWLKAEAKENTCRILSNVRCLSEGVDVPALDAVMFLTPRNSQVDVVQSVGRVMRLAPNKEMGYIILPVVIPAGVEPEVALNDNKTYRVVWQVLQALRSHDDRFDAMINKMDLIGNDPDRMEVIAVTNTLQGRGKSLTAEEKQLGAAKTGSSIGKPKSNSRYKEDNSDKQEFLDFNIGEIEQGIYSKLVQVCGNRNYWQDWSDSIAQIAQTHIDRIGHIINDAKNEEEIAAFNEFALELRDDLNNEITDDEIIEMLAQHLITKPVFEALFDQYDFAKHNPISKAMDKILALLERQNLQKESKELEGFYDGVKMRAAGIGENPQARQQIIVELYDRFFRKAFPRMTERLGIVYTPVEVVDFIIHSVEDVLNDQFDSSLADDNVHIIDPFTGTGTFITRLLQSGIIPNDKLPHKFREEIHANELILLAYYIAAINIESAYHAIIGGDYEPFNGICLTDTFQLYEEEDLVDALLEENSARRKRQKELPIKVIIGNPPYSSGQTSANDNNANYSYPSLDESISNTYAAASTATSTKNLMDSYIRSIRWASNRIGKKGVIGFVTNATFIDGNSMDGMRKCLAEEFTTLYLFHLRGNQRTSGELSRREGGKIFDAGSRAPIVISLMVKDPNVKEQGKIYLHDIGDYLNRLEKLEIIENFKSINGISQSIGWQEIVPDQFNDWVNQRDPNFDNYMVLGEKRDKSAIPIFDNYSLGIGTNRDDWAYNFSRKKLKKNINITMDTYNSLIENDSREEFDIKNHALDNTKIKWASSLNSYARRNILMSFSDMNIVKANYRPFCKQFLYYDRMLNHRVGQMPNLFPDNKCKNIVFGVTGRGARNGLTITISNTLVDLNMLEAGTQCFPLKLYEKIDETKGTEELFDEGEIEGDYIVKDAITDAALQHFQAPYTEAITKEDIFYYIYGILHSEEYRERYADNLSKELPRIPRMKTFEGFKAFSDAGRALADLHLNYETVDPYPVNYKGFTNLSHLSDNDFYVKKMRFGKKKDEEGKNVNDRSTVVYNAKITMKDIPEEAYEYIVNGKPALEWVMERQAVTTHKASGIENDANDWAIETMNNARYPLELFQRVITVSLRTMKIVNALPALDLLEN